MDVLAIFGPPGTGKTRTLIDFAGSVESGLYLSYTKAAAAEAVSRLPNQDKIKASTIHSMAFNALNMNRASVVDKVKLEAFSKVTGIPFKGTEFGSDEDQEGDEYYQVLSFARNMCMLDDDDYDAVYQRFGCPGTRSRWMHFLSTYQKWKEAYGYMDFDDMLDMYSKNGRGWAKNVFLDEAQDCTPLQWRAFEVACSRAERVFVAGDDDQAIYEWNGANPHGMVEFMEKHEGEMLILAKSYRLSKTIWEFSLGVIEKVDKRVSKAFSHSGSAGEVTRWGDFRVALDRLEQVAPDGALILCRDRFRLEEMKKMLNQDLLPYDVYGGVSPWTSKIATALKRGERVHIPAVWQRFYDQADLSKPITYHLSTIHSAKGREHQTVIMDLDMPSRVLQNLTIDSNAERRVQYVGLTRAAEHLHICGSNPII